MTAKRSRRESASPSDSRRKTAMSGVSRRALLIAGAGAGAGILGWLALAPSQSAAGPAVTIWKSPDCECCGGWASYMRRLGYDVTISETADIAEVKERLGVPADLQSCHTSRVEGYVLEGHVPAAAIAKLLAERPELKGIALPGMPTGAPGMGGPAGSYRIMSFDGIGRPRLFAEVTA